MAFEPSRVWTVGEDERSPRLILHGIEVLLTRHAGTLRLAQLGGHRVAGDLGAPNVRRVALLSSLFVAPIIQYVWLLRSVPMTA